MLKVRIRGFVLLETILCLLIVCALITSMRLFTAHSSTSKIEQNQLIMKVKTNLQWGIRSAFLSKRAVFIQYSKKQQLLTLKSGTGRKSYLKFPVGYDLEMPGNEVIINKTGYVAPKTIILRGPNGFRHRFRIQMAWGEIYEN